MSAVIDAQGVCDLELSMSGVRWTDADDSAAWPKPLDKPVPSTAAHPYLNATHGHACAVAWRRLAALARGGVEALQVQAMDGWPEQKHPQ